jgi:hypothetical protein
VVFFRPQPAICQIIIVSQRRILFILYIHVKSPSRAVQGSFTSQKITCWFDSVFAFVLFYPVYPDHRCKIFGSFKARQRRAMKLKFLVPWWFIVVQARFVSLRPIEKGRIAPPQILVLSRTSEYCKFRIKSNGTFGRCRTRFSMVPPLPVFSLPARLGGRKQMQLVLLSFAQNSNCEIGGGVREPRRRALQSPPPWGVAITLL